MTIHIFFIILSYLTQVYSPQSHLPRRDENNSKYGTEVYSTSLNSSEYRKTTNDYYYNKENEFHSKKHDTETTLLPPRSDKYSTSYVTKNYSSRDKNNGFNPISSPIHVKIFHSMIFKLDSSFE